MDGSGAGNVLKGEGERDWEMWGKVQGGECVMGGGFMKYYKRGR